MLHDGESNDDPTISIQVDTLQNKIIQSETADNEKPTLF